jgi:hypothetical protein
MKSILLLITVFLFWSSVKGQFANDSISGKVPDSPTPLLSVAAFKPATSFIMFNGDTINREILLIDQNGNMFYRPSFFSKCDTSTEMRFLYNIHTGEMKKSEN